MGRLVAVGGWHTRLKNDRLHESIAVYLKMQNSATNEEFAVLLRQHDTCTDADDKPRLRARTLAEVFHFFDVTLP